jgi:hypothetical protein
MAAALAYSEAVTALAPDVYYHMDETSGLYLDSIGGARGMTLAGTGSTRGVPGLIADSAAALRMNGSGTCYRNVEAWMTPPTGRWTLSAIFKATAYGRQICGCINASSPAYKLLMLRDNVAGPTFDYGAIAVQAQIASSLRTVVDSTKVAPYNNWSPLNVLLHGLARFDGTNLQVFRNGVLQATGSFGALTGTVGVGMGICTSGSQAFMGDVDEFFYMGRAITDLEIETIIGAYLS